MSYRFLFEIFYYLPLFFFTLGQSPNFTQGAIVGTLVSGMVIATPLLGAVRYLALAKRSKWLKHPNLVIASALLILLYFVSKGEPIILLAVMVAIPFLLIAFTVNKYLGEVIMGVFLFAIYYLGINQFGTDQLLKINLLPTILTGAIFFTWYRNKSLGKWEFLLFAGLFVLLCWMGETLPYLPLLLVPIVARVVINIFRPHWKTTSDIISGILIGAYFVYYFLFANHVIQALTGGL